MLVVVLETQVAALDHGTHLLLALAAVLGTAVVLGPRPAVSGLLGGAFLAGAASVLGVTGAPDAAVQLLAYLLVGSASIVLAALAIRSGRQPAPVAEAAVAASPVAASPVAAAAVAEADGPPNPGSSAPVLDAPLAPLARRASPTTRPTGVAVDGLVELLTAREAEVLRMAATGSSVEEMAGRLGVSPNTVKTHLTHLYAKLGVRGRTDAVRAALHSGWLSPGDICPHHFGAEDENHRFR